MEIIAFSYLIILLIVKFLAPELELWKTIIISIPIVILNWFPAFTTYYALKKEKEGIKNDS